MTTNTEHKGEKENLGAFYYFLSMVGLSILLLLFLLVKSFFN